MARCKMGSINYGCQFVCLDLSNHQKIVDGCFDVVLVDTFGDIKLLELNEMALDLTFHNTSLI